MKNRIICMIPARIGSQRFKQKNLALIDDKPVLAWGIESAINSKIFDQIIINGDNILFKKIAEKYNLQYYNRNSLLSSSDAKSDDVIYDFINQFDCEYIVWFNAIAPLQTKKDIKDFATTLIQDNFNSLFSVQSNYIQALFEESPINFSTKDKFSKTQDLKPIKSFVPSMMGWESKIFKQNYLKKEYSFFSGSVGYYEIKSRLTSLVIKNEDDFKLIRSVIEGFKSYNNKVEYYSE